MALLSSHSKGNQYFQVHWKFVDWVFAAMCMQFVFLPGHPLEKSDIRITLWNMTMPIRSCVEFMVREDKCDKEMNYCFNVLSTIAHL